MRKKLYSAFNKLYGILMSVAFWGGIIPLVPFIAAVIIGGATGEKIANFLYNQYYPWVIALASIAIIVGLIGMYIGKIEAFSTKSLGKKENA